MKLFIGKDYWGDRGYFLLQVRYKQRYFYNKNAKEFEVNTTVRGSDADIYYMSFPALASVLATITYYGDTVEVANDIKDNEVRNFVATLKFAPPQESVATKDSFELGGAL